MNSRFVICLILALLAFATVVADVAAQQLPPLPGVPVHMVVTAETRHGAKMPAIDKADVMVFEGRDRDTVADWMPFQGDRAGLDLFILLDDASTFSLGTQLEDIRQFINAQPTMTRIGLAYMQDGVAQVVQNLTSDHALVAKALRLPEGIPGVNGGPYFSVGDLLKKWPEGSPRREVVIATDGVDRFFDNGPEDPYVSEVIEQAQKVGVIVFVIYTPGVGHFAHSYLPYLNDLAQRLNRQYLLTFLAKPEKKAGMRRVRLSTEVPNVELVGADNVYVPAGQ